MQVHSAYYWLKEGLSESDLLAFEKGLKSLTESGTVQSGHFGAPAATEKREVVDDTYDYGLVLVFDDVAAHNVYQEGDIHQTFVAEHAAKFDRVKVYDVQS